MNYAVVLHKDEGSDFGVTVPDLPGCFSAGATVDDALAMAREAIELHLEGLVESGQPAPLPVSIDEHQKNPVYAGGTWAIVTVDPSTLRLRVKRISMTIPERTLDAVDRFASAHGDTRSGLMARATIDYIQRHGGSGVAVRARRGRPRNAKGK